MPIQEFWYGNPLHFFIYLEAYSENMEREMERQDFLAYNQGVYTLLALRQSLAEVFSKKGGKSIKIYPKKSFTENEKAKKKDKNVRKPEDDRNLLFSIAKRMGA